MFMVFSKASEGDKKEIMKLYRAAIGSMGCTWSMEYPTAGHLEEDFVRGDLFCLKDAENDEVIGAVSVDKDEQVEALKCWSLKGAELARLVVKEKYQNMGIAGLLIKNAMAVLKKRGYTYVHFLVSKNHIKALKAYEKLNFNKVGDTCLYGENWWCYEKKLEGDGINDM